MEKREPKKLQMLGKFGGGIDVTGAKVGQIIEVAAVDESGKPTAWKAADKPKKLSELENDLFYASATEVLTLTKEDFTPQYEVNGDGIPNRIGYCYKGAHALDWFTSPDKIGFVVQITEDGEQIVISHHVPNIAAQWNDDMNTNRDYLDPEEYAYPIIACENCGIDIVNGVWLPLDGEPIPEDCFTVLCYGNGDFDSITIYKVDAKKISKDLYDRSDIEKALNEAFCGIEDAIGYASQVETNLGTKMSADNPVGTGAFSMGRKAGTTIGERSHAEGSNTTASGTESHAEGHYTTASGQYSHAEGGSTTASAYYSHAEGGSTTASGQASHAEGYSTTASGQYSHAEGDNTIASHKSAHVYGEYNIKDPATTSAGERGTYVHIVGNGTGKFKRSNAHTLDWHGVPWYQGRPQFGGNAQDDGSQTVMANGDKELILASSTEGSEKKFRITVDDSGTITATEVTA